MSQIIPLPDTVFNPFEEPITSFSLPGRFTYPFDYTPHPLSLLAVEKLQLHLTNQQDWDHNFGLSGNLDQVIGKMFGVLVVRTLQNEIGYLAAFSGKLAGGNHHAGFVPPIFDGMAEDGFLNKGMSELTRINQEIKGWESLDTQAGTEYVKALKMKRKAHSIALQNEIFDQYHFLNQAGKRKSLRDVFDDGYHSNPPAGAGECAAPKLLQFAFQQKMTPVCMAEFWWGLSPKSDFWKHGHFYPACREKCGPILAHMLSETATDVKPS